MTDARDRLSKLPPSIQRPLRGITRMGNNSPRRTPRMMLFAENDAYDDLVIVGGGAPSSSLAQPAQARRQQRAIASSLGPLPPSAWYSTRTHDEDEGNDASSPSSSTRRHRACLLAVALCALCVLTGVAMTAVAGKFTGVLMGDVGRRHSDHSVSVTTAMDASTDEGEMEDENAGPLGGDNAVFIATGEGSPRSNEDGDGSGVFGVSMKRSNISIPGGNSNSSATIALPALYDANLADVVENVTFLGQNGSLYIDDENNGGVPFFWEIPLSGGGALRSILGPCLKLVQTTGVGVEGGHDKDAELKVLKIRGNQYVNVDTTTAPGLARAANLDLASSDMADVVVSPLLSEATSALFSSDDGPSRRRGRLFTVLRHPVERAIGMYHYHRMSRDMTMERYATSDVAEDNWLVRRLTDLPVGEDVTQEHLEVAREILRRKCVVGIMSDFRKTVDVFEAYFGWHIDSNAKMCQDTVVRQVDRQRHHPTLKRDSRAWRALQKRNYWDMQLYTYALELFKKSHLLPVPSS